MWETINIYSCEEENKQINNSEENSNLLNIKQIKLPFWTEKEDKIILEFGRSLKRNKWVEAAKLVNNKTPRHCYFRYKTINPECKKGFWTKEEDELLLKYIKLFGNNWSAISKLMKTRSNKQIHNRFKILVCSNKLDNKKNDNILNNRCNDKNNNLVENKNVDTKFNDHLSVNFMNKPNKEIFEGQLLNNKTNNDIVDTEVKMGFNNFKISNLNDISTVCNSNNLHFSNYEKALYKNFNDKLFGSNSDYAPASNFNFYSSYGNKSNINQVSFDNFQYCNSNNNETNQENSINNCFYSNVNLSVNNE